MQLSVDDRVQFELGGTPMVGKVLFAVGTRAVALQLDSGTQLIVDLDTVKRVAK